MGSIVFSTIAENIRSFFSKEEELLAQPKKIPEAASEVFEHPSAPKKIVERSLPREADLQLPFSPAELKAAVAKKAPPKEEPELDLREFESTLHHVHQEDALVPTKSAPAEIPLSLSSTQEGFFDEFEQFLLHEDLEADGLLDTDVLHRMREFHRHQQEGKEYYVYSRDVKQAIQRKMQELKTLEREWFHTRRQMDELERGLHGLEHEIEGRVTEVKSLLVQARSRSRLEQRVPQGQEFVLRDGRKLASLLDLKIALRTMPTDVFHHHVDGKRNDFAAWVRSSLGDEQVAAEIARLTDRRELDVLLSRLAG